MARGVPCISAKLEARSWCRTKLPPSYGECREQWSTRELLTQSVLFQRSARRLSVGSVPAEPELPAFWRRRQPEFIGQADTKSAVGRHIGNGCGKNGDRSRRSARSRLPEDSRYDLPGFGHLPAGRETVSAGFSLRSAHDSGECHNAR